MTSNSLLGKSGGNTISGNNHAQLQKQDLLSQFNPNLKEQLLSHTWNIINYNPLEIIYCS